jgi:hypothetical protein
VQEKLDFVDASEPDAESRRYGWVGPEEFRRWLIEKRKAFAPKS